MKKWNSVRRYLDEIDKRLMKAELLSLPLMQDFSPQEQHDILLQVKWFYLDKGQMVFVQDEPSDYMYIIVRGHVKIYHTTVEGKELIFYLYQRGDFIGGLNMLQNTPYLYNGQAADDCLIVALPRRSFDLYIHNNPKLLRRLLSKSFDRVRWVENSVQLLSETQALPKVAGVLLWFKDIFGKVTENGIRLELFINREEMGNYAGLRRETMTRKLVELKDMGYIDFIGNKVIIIKDVEGLESIT